MATGELDLNTMLLLGMGSQLMKPRYQGGGFAGLGDSALGISQAYGNAQSQKLYRQAQQEELQSRADERATKTAQAKYQAEQRRRLMLEAGGGQPQDAGMQGAGMQGAVPHEAMVMPESLAAQGVRSRFNPALEQAAKSQGGGQAPANGKPYQLKVMEYVNAGFSDDMAKVLANKDSGRQEVARTVEIPGPNGPMIQQLSKTGDPIGDPIPKAIAMKFLQMGDRQLGVNEHTGQATGASFAMGQSPDSRASNYTSQRNADLVNARAKENNAIALTNRQNTDLAKSREDADGIRKEFNSLPEVKAIKEIIPAQQSATDAMKRNTALADINLVYATAKIFDPTSVVREGEYATVNNASPPAERLQGLLQHLTGGGKLTANTRKAMLDEINSRADAAQGAYEAARASYGSIVDQRGYKHSDVFQNLPPLSKSASQTASGQIKPANKSEAALFDQIDAELARRPK